MGSRQDIHDKILGVYAIYPRKLGKSAGIKKALLQCKTMEQANALERAVARYIRHIMSEGTEPCYVMYFSTFMNSWRDWLDPDVGGVLKVKADLSGLGFEE